MFPQFLRVGFSLPSSNITPITDLSLILKRGPSELKWERSLLFVSLWTWIGTWLSYKVYLPFNFPFFISLLVALLPLVSPRAFFYLRGSVSPSLVGAIFLGDGLSPSQRFNFLFPPGGEILMPLCAWFPLL